MDRNLIGRHDERDGKIDLAAVVDPREGATKCQLPSASLKEFLKRGVLAVTLVTEGAYAISSGCSYILDVAGSSPAALATTLPVSMVQPRKRWHVDKTIKPRY